jgi:hypothetical protein
MTKELMKAGIVRAMRTVAQTALATIGTAAEHTTTTVVKGGATYDKRRKNKIK